MEWFFASMNGKERKKEELCICVFFFLLLPILLVKSDMEKESCFLFVMFLQVQSSEDEDRCTKRC